MTRNETIERLRNLEPELRRRGVLSLFLFGSVARDEAHQNSDVDLFFDDDPARPLSLFKVIDVGLFLKDALGTSVDLIPRDSLHRLIRDDVAASAVRVY
jgi:predicted nucleotidyltransferase